MAANPMNNKNLGRTHSKELAKNNRGKRTRKTTSWPCKTGKRKRKFRIWWFDGYTDDTEGTGTA